MYFPAGPRDLAAEDVGRLARCNVPANFVRNLAIVETFVKIGERNGVTSGQLALAWGIEADWKGVGRGT